MKAYLIESGSGKLSDFVSVHTGVRAKIGQKNIVSKVKVGETWHKGLISGSEINKYVINYDGNFLNIDSKILWSGGWDPEIVLNDKLLLRQTGDSLIAAYDNNKYYHLNNLHSIAPKDGKPETLKLVLALLNSKLFDFYYRLISLETGRTMAQTDIETIELLPIKIPQTGLNDELIGLVDEILASNGDMEITRRLQMGLDWLIYKLYGLTPEEIEMVEKRGKR